MVKRRDDAADEPVASLLEAAAAPSEPGPLTGEAEALAAFRASRSASQRAAVTSRATARSAVAAVLGTGVVLTGGVAAAATGALPGSAQAMARDMLGIIGVEVPGPDEPFAGYSDQSGVSENAPAKDQHGSGEATEVDTTEADTDAAGKPVDREGKGGRISALAKSNLLAGHQKGTAVSELASRSEARAGHAHGTMTEARSGSDSADGPTEAGMSGDTGMPEDAHGTGEAPTMGSSAEAERGGERAEQAEQGHPDNSGGNTSAGQQSSGREAGGAADRR